MYRSWPTRAATQQSCQRPPRDRQRDRGQSLVEFALVLPVILLLLLVALDFGRVYLGYINVQNMARIAANTAAGEPTIPWGSSTDTRVIAYRNQVLNDAHATNCSLPQVAGQSVVPPPVFTDSTGNGATTDVGDSVTVAISCRFGVITPLISSIVGGSINVSASAMFPVKSGMVATGGGGSGPAAAFTATPTSGVSPLTVQFTDQSTGSPTAWSWDFNDDGIADSTAQDPTYTFTGVGAFTVTLVASNANGSSTLTKTNYISATVAPATVSFTASPTSGTAPLDVTFTDTSTGSPTAWAWDFNNDGTVDSTLQNPLPYRYTSVGTYTVKLTVTNAGGTASKTVANMITVQVGTCTVPNFAGQSSSSAQSIWSAAGFTTTVQFQQGGRPWTIVSQNQVVGQAIPCNSTITVSKN